MACPQCPWAPRPGCLPPVAALARPCGVRLQAPKGEASCEAVILVLREKSGEMKGPLYGMLTDVPKPQVSVT